LFGIRKEAVTTQEVFTSCRSGVAQVSLEVGGEVLTAGTAFLVPGGLMTNSHVLRDVGFDVAVLRFEEMDYGAGIRLARDICLQAVAYDSPSNEHDVAFLRLDEPEFAGRHVFSFGDSDSLAVGDQVAFLGYPFRMQHLTCHVGYVSSLHQRAKVDVIQIDASVNGGNSGGPLVELRSGSVVGIISRAEVGFLADQFDAMIQVLGQNIDQLNQPTGARVVIAGVDPVQGLRASQTAMREIAVNLRRSANVGIGYAFGSNHVRDRLAQQ
jgi:S1-C subfamily serine protease